MEISASPLVTISLKHMFSSLRPHSWRTQSALIGQFMVKKMVESRLEVEQNKPLGRPYTNPGNLRLGSK